MINIAEYTTLVRGNVGLPTDFLFVAEEFGEDWSFVESGDSRDVADETWTPRWRLSRAAPATQRNGVGQTDQEAIASALKLALRGVDECFGVAVVEQIELTKYPWFVLAKINVSPYQIQRGLGLAVSSESLEGLLLPLPGKAPTLQAVTIEL